MFLHSLSTLDEHIPRIFPVAFAGSPRGVWPDREERARSLCTHAHMLRAPVLLVVLANSAIAFTPTSPRLFRPHLAAHKPKAQAARPCPRVEGARMHVEGGHVGRLRSSAAALAAAMLVVISPMGRPAVAIAAPVATEQRQEAVLADPRLSGGRISDSAQLLGPEYRRRVASEIAKIERRVPGTQVLVVTVRDTPTTPKRFATSLFNDWGVGDARTNNGVLLLVAKDARRVEIECGVSLNYRFSSAWCNSMLKTNVVPALKEGNYDEGVLAAVQQIGARLAEADASASAPAIAVAHNTGQAVSQESDFTNDVFLPVVLGGTLGIGAVVLQNDDDDDDNGTPRQKKSAPRYRRRSSSNRGYSSTSYGGGGSFGGGGGGGSFGGGGGGGFSDGGGGGGAGF